MLGLLLGVQRYQLHALGLTELDSAPPVEVVPVLPPGEEVALAIVLVVPLRPGGLAHSLGSSRLLHRPGGARGPGGSGDGGGDGPGHSLAELVHHEGFDPQRSHWSRGGGGSWSGGGRCCSGGSGGGAGCRLSCSCCWSRCGAGCSGGGSSSGARSSRGRSGGGGGGGGYLLNGWLATC